MNKIKVLLVDDHPVVLTALRAVLATEDDFQVVGEASDGRKAVDLAGTLKPDVIVMDLAMPIMNGIDATELIKSQLPDTKVLILSVHFGKEHLLKSVEIGASGYLDKQSAANFLLEAIRRVYNGGTFCTPNMQDELEKGMLSIIYGFGFTAKEHIALAEKLISEPPEERFDRVIVANKINSRDRHLKALRQLVKKVREMDQAVDEKYAQWRETKASSKKRVFADFKKLDKKLQDTFPKFYYKQKVIEEMILVAQNIHDKMQASLWAITDLEKARKSDQQQAILKSEWQKINALEEFVRMPREDYFNEFDLLKNCVAVKRNINSELSPSNNLYSPIANNKKLAETEEAAARNSLTKHDFKMTLRHLALAEEHDPLCAMRLRSEFGFLFESLDAEGNLLDDSPDCLTQLQWSIGIWKVLSKRNMFPLEPSEFQEVGASQTISQAPSTNVILSSGTAEQKGEELEQAVVRLFRTFFRLGEDNAIKIRQQKRGTQGGFDVSIEWSGKCEVATGQLVRCHLECKNYQNLITLKDVADKLLSEPYRKGIIEHWILISPHANPSNELNRFLETQHRECRFPFDVQIWCPETGVQEFFGLEPDVYDQFYPNSSEIHPRTWDQKHIAAVKNRWRSRLEPSLRLPVGWSMYVRDPDKLCSPPENPSELNDTYMNYVPMRCRNSAGVLLQKPLNAYIEEWLEQKGRPVMFLLGEFGDGKTSFTYVLGRQLLNAWPENRQTGWLPLRLSLKKFPGNAREFLRQRLEEFGSEIGGWLELGNSARRLVILDGFDEMSVNIGPAAIIENIKSLLSCIREFEGCKILVTSRTHFFANRQDSKRLMDRLGNPPTYYLAPIGRQEVIRHLTKMVSGGDAQQLLTRVRQMNDPIGLAGKPLFLDMLKDVLAGSSLPKNLDVFELYEHYIEQALARKADLLDDAEFRSDPESTIKNLQNILGDIAEELQRTGAGFVSLTHYRNKDAKPFAELLWQLSGDSDADQDARRRVGVRSLLARVIYHDTKDEWGVDFCHRSMREYFVALRLCKALNSGVEIGGEFLRNVPLNHEILQFAAERCLKFGSLDVIQTLLRIILSAKTDSAPGQMGGQALTLLFRLDPKLPHDFDWTGKVFDGADLEEADLSGMDFRRSSFCYANLANVNLENANFEDADLSGVRIEETKPIVALAVPPDGERIFAFYGDGILREWRAQVWGKAITRVLASMHPAPGSTIGFHECGRMWLCSPGEWVFLASHEHGWKTQGAFPIKDAYRCVSLSKANMTLVEESEVGSFRILLIDIEKYVLLGAHSARDARWCDVLGNDALVWSDAEVGFRVVSVLGSPSKREINLKAEEQTCLATRQCSRGFYLIAGGTSTGRICIWRLDLRTEPWVQQKLLETIAHDGPITSVAFISDNSLVSGGADRTIAITQFGENLGLGGSLERRFQLTLRCRGMKIKGLKGSVERKMLEELIADSQQNL
jgi:DNA-binding NarL/FixJ family response regulator